MKIKGHKREKRMRKYSLCYVDSLRKDEIDILMFFFFFSFCRYNLSNEIRSFLQKYRILL